MSTRLREVPLPRDTTLGLSEERGWEGGGGERGGEGEGGGGSMGQTSPSRIINAPVVSTLSHSCQREVQAVFLWHAACLLELRRRRRSLLPAVTGEASTARCSIQHGDLGPLTVSDWSSLLRRQQVGQPSLYGSYGVYGAPRLAPLQQRAMSIGSRHPGATLI